MRSAHHCCFRAKIMAEYEELVSSAAGYDSDDSGADTDEEVNNGRMGSCTHEILTCAVYVLHMMRNNLAI